jgi:hypothetical protein
MATITTLASIPDPGGVFTGANQAAINVALAAQNTNNTNINTQLATLAGNVTVDTINLTLAQLLALNATPAVIVAAQGAGTLVVFHWAVIEWVRGSAAFTIGSATNLTFSYKSDASGGAASVALAATGFFDQAASQIRTVQSITTNVNTTGDLNQPLVLSLAVADMTVGTGGSGIVKVGYSIISGLQ